jgi:hypothetical protein
MLLVQMMRHAREMGVPVPAEAKSLVAKLRSPLGDGVAQQSEILGRDRPRAEDLMALVRLTGQQRYSSESAPARERSS